jgi:hypothetical protein
MYFTFPDTLNKPLEEVAAMFGDDYLVAVYQRDLVVGSDQDVTATMEEKPAELKKTPLHGVGTAPLRFISRKR